MMWKFLLLFTGSTLVHIEIGSPEWLLEKLVKNNIFLAEIHVLNEFSMEILIPASQTERLCSLVQTAGGECRILKRQGIGYTFRGLRARPWLLVSLLAAAALVVILPKFVFFYEVEGNETVSDAQILRTLQQLGVGFGTYGPNIHPQELKNEMIYRIPKLRWFTVQQNGMCAKVVVRERKDVEKIYDRKTPTNVVASRSGIVSSVDCFAGDCLCYPGQAVVQGQLLVSAYTDFGFKTQVTAAEAEIYADTVRRFSSVLPLRRTVRETPKRTQRDYRLCIGTKALSVGKSQSLPEGAKQQVEYRALTLPGGFSFPIGIEITTVYEYDIKEEVFTSSQAERMFQCCAQQYVQGDMIAGTVQSQQIRVEHTGNGYAATCVFQCHEMIARMVAASIKEESE